MKIKKCGSVSINNHSMSVKEKDRIKFYNMLMNTNVKTDNLTSNNNRVIFSNDNNHKDNETREDGNVDWKTIYKKHAVISPNDGLLKRKNTHNISENLSNDNFAHKSIFQGDFSTKNKVLKLKNKRMNKIKKKLLNYKNDPFNSSLKKNNNSFNFVVKPFLLRDKIINDSFANNKDNKNNKVKKFNKKININKKNNNHNHNNNKLFNIDFNSNRNNNNSLVFQNPYSSISKSQNLNTYKNNDQNNFFSENIPNYRSGDSINISNEQTIEAEKIKRPKKFMNNKIRNNMLTSDIKLDTFKNINRIKKNDKIKQLISDSSGNISDNYNCMTNLKEFNDGYISDKKPKIKLKTSKIKPLPPLKYLLFNNVDKKESKIRNYNKIIYHKTSMSTDSYNNTDNLFFNRAKGPSQIESCIISFRDSKIIKNHEEEEKNKIINFSPKIEYNKIKYIKKINKEKNSYEKYFNRNNLKINKYNLTSYKLYKKPTLPIGQNLIKTFNQAEGINNFCSHSQVNIYKKTETDLNNQNNLFKSQFLGSMYKKININNNNKNHSNKIGKIFIKKNLPSLISIDSNIYNHINKNIGSPIYIKKSPPYLKTKTPKLYSTNINDNKSLTNNYSCMNMRNKNKNQKIYIRGNNTNLNSHYRIFNSQVINIKNNIFNNNNYYPNETVNNTPFSDEAKVERINVNRKKFKNDNIRTKVKNKHHFCNKFYKYSYYLKVSLSEPKIKYNNSTIIKNEKIIKKNILPICYYTKFNYEIYKIPNVSKFYCTKMHLLKYKYKKNKIENPININKDEIKSNSKDLNQNRILLNENKIFNQDIIFIKKNTDTITNINPLKNEKVEKKQNEKVVDTNINKIRVIRKKNILKNINENMNNIKKIESNTNSNTNKTEINENTINTNNYSVSTLTNNINSINNSIPIAISNIISKNSLKTPNKNIRSKYNIRSQRSSSHKMKNKKIIKNMNNINSINNFGSNTNIIKVNLPNSEARRKKYKINVVKRLKIRYKKNLNDFSEEKMLINNLNNDVNEKIGGGHNMNRKRYKTTKNDKKEKKILAIIKEDLENYISFSFKNQQNKKFVISNNYDFSIIEQLLIKEKIELNNLLRYYLKICFEILDSKDKILFANDYIQNIIENYKRIYINKNNFIQIHEDLLEILVDVVSNINKNKLKDIINCENKYMYEIIGALFYSLLLNDLFFVSDLNKFINCEEQILMNIAKIVRFIIIYSNDEKLKNKYFEVFKNCKLFFNNPVYFKYVTKYLKFLNTKYYN